MRQVTAKNRYACALAVVTDWCRTNRHRSIHYQHAHLSAMMRGHYEACFVAGADASPNGAVENRSGDACGVRSRPMAGIIRYRGGGSKSLPSSYQQDAMRWH